MTAKIYAILYFLGISRKWVVQSPSGDEFRQLTTLALAQKYCGDRGWRYEFVIS